MYFGPLVESGNIVINIIEFINRKKRINIVNITNIARCTNQFLRNIISINYDLILIILIEIIVIKPISNFCRLPVP